MKNIEPTDAKHRRVLRASDGVRARLASTAFGNSTFALGVPEIVGLSVSLLLLLTALAAYFYLLAPQRERLRLTQTRITEQEKLLRESGQGFEQGTTAQATVAEITASLRTFEADNLSSRAEGQQATIESIFNSVRRNNLRDTGQSFALVEADPPERVASRSGRKPNVYPAFNLTVGVEGAYPNVRRFMHDIETSTQFVIINSIELEGVRNAETGGATGANTPVSLNLNMAAYFRPTTKAATATDTRRAAPRNSAAAAPPAR